MDQGSTMKRSAVHNFAPTVTKFCLMWEGQALPHDTKFGNSRCEIVGRRVIFIWSLIHGLRWSGLIKAEPGVFHVKQLIFLVAFGADDDPLAFHMVIHFRSVVWNNNWSVRLTLLVCKFDTTGGLKKAQQFNDLQNMMMLNYMKTTKTTVLIFGKTWLKLKS